MVPRAPTTRRRGASRPDESGDTRERLLDAAERLFATGGLAGTSLRAVTSAAGVNVAAVHYHFGSKEELLRCVFARRVAPLNEARLKRLDELEARGAEPSVEALLDAFLRPALEFAAEHPGLGDLACLLYSEPAEQAAPLLHEIFGEVSERFTRALARVLPQLDPTALHARFAFCVGALVQVIANRGPVELPPRETLPRLVRFLAAGLAAPCDSGPRAPAREHA